MTRTTQARAKARLARINPLLVVTGWIIAAYAQAKASKRIVKRTFA